MTEEADRVLRAERPQLIALAYRMLGTLADAEDAVQEGYVRWLRLTEAERAAIEVPGAWLTRVVGRICLDVLGSARVRRERYVGEWLPEPVPAHDPVAAAADPLDRVTLDDTVSMALLVVLDALTPAERVAFVLHDVFGLSFAEIGEIVGRSPAATRQLASSARRHVRERRAGLATRESHDDLVRAFAAACRTGDLAAVTAVLDPGVVLRSDGGGVVSAARRPIRGSDNVARFVLGVAERRPDVALEPVLTPDGLGFVARDARGVHSVWTFGAAGGRVTDVWVVLTPAKLTLWA